MFFFVSNQVNIYIYNKNTNIVMFSYNEYNKVNESIKQARQYLTNKNIDIENNEALDMLSHALRKRPNLIGNFVKYHYEENIELNTLIQFIQYMNNNKATFDKLPKNLIDYNKFEYIQDDLMVLERDVITVKFYKYLHPDLQAQISRLPLAQKDELDNIVIAYRKLPEDKKKAFTPMKFYKVNKTDVKDFIERMKEFVENLDAGKEEIKTALEKHPGTYEIVYNEDNAVILKTANKDLIIDIGSPTWCIVYASDTYYSRYVAPETLNTQYIIFNFNYALSSRYSRFGITIQMDGIAKSGGCQDNTNTYISIPDIAHSISVDEDILKSILVNEHMKLADIVINNIDILRYSDNVNKDEIEKVFKIFEELGISPTYISSYLDSNVFNGFGGRRKHLNGGISNELERTRFGEFNDYTRQCIISLADNDTKLTFDDIKQYPKINSVIYSTLLKKEVAKYTRKLIDDTESISDFNDFIRNNNLKESILYHVYDFENKFATIINHKLDNSELKFTELNDEVKAFIIEFCDESLNISYEEIQPYKHLNVELLNILLKHHIIDKVYEIVDKESLISFIGIFKKEKIEYKNVTEYIADKTYSNLTNHTNSVFLKTPFNEFDEDDRKYIISFSSYASTLTFHEVKEYRDINPIFVDYTEIKYLSRKYDDIKDAASLKLFLQLVDDNNHRFENKNLIEEFTLHLNDLIEREAFKFSDLDEETKRVLIPKISSSINISSSEIKPYSDLNNYLYSSKIYRDYMCVLDSGFKKVEDLEELFKITNIFKSLGSGVVCDAEQAVIGLAENKQFFPNIDRILEICVENNYTLDFDSIHFPFDWVDVEPFFNKTITKFLLKNKNILLSKSNYKSIPNDILKEYFYEFLFYMVMVMANNSSDSNIIDIMLPWNNCLDMLSKYINNIRTDDELSIDERISVYINIYLKRFIKIFASDEGFVKYVFEHKIITEQILNEFFDFDYEYNKVFITNYLKIAKDTIDVDTYEWLKEYILESVVLNYKDFKMLLD
jgi:hypothetical protein